MRLGRPLIAWICLAGCAQASEGSLSGEDVGGEDVGEAGGAGDAGAVGLAGEGEGEAGGQAGDPGAGEGGGKVDAPASCVDLDDDGYGEDCDDGPDCDDEDDAVHPGAEDLCGDGVDQDCSGYPDDPEGGCAQCAPGERRDCALGGCLGEATCGANGLWAACEVSPETEICDGRDNDCDLQVDEDVQEGPVCGCGAPVCAEGSWGCPLDERLPQCVCGAPLCLPGGWACPSDGDLGEACESDEAGVCTPGAFVCRDDEIRCAPGVSPGEREEVCNGADDDCDGEVDEDDADAGVECDTGGVGECGRGERTCLGGRLVCAPVHERIEERCEDGLDDDCDGEIDESPPCPSCERDAGEAVERGCVHNDSPQCSGHTPDWGHDCDLGVAKTLVGGSISHDGDEDWYYATGQDGLCEMTFEADLIGIPEDADYDMCAWWINADGTPAEIECDGLHDAADVLGDVDWNHFDGAPGCCSRRLGDLRETVKLTGDFTRGVALIRVWGVRGRSCEPYQLRYWF